MIGAGVQSTVWMGRWRSSQPHAPRARPGNARRARRLLAFPGGPGPGTAHHAM